MEKSFFNVPALAMLAVCAFAAPSAYADQNFVSGNGNNDGQFTPRKVFRPKDPNRAPGFWEKEFKRSGLSEFGGAAKWKPFSDMGKFLKEKEDAVRAKRAGGAPESSQAASVATAVK